MQPAGKRVSAYAPLCLKANHTHAHTRARAQPTKFVAKLRACRPPTSRRLLLLKMDMVGHFSVTGRFDKLKEVRVPVCVEELERGYCWWCVWVQGAALCTRILYSATVKS